MEINGITTRNTQYYPEIYSLVGILLAIIIYAIISSIYYFRHFTESKINKVKFISNILLSSGLMAGFLCIFYFTYLKNIEKQVFIDNIRDVINTIVSVMPYSIKSFLAALIPENFKLQVFTDVNETSDANPDANPDVNPNADNGDADIIASNKNIIIKAILIFGTLCILIFIGVTILLYKTGKNIVKIYGVNLLLLSSIAFMETIFATYFVSNIITIDINNVIYMLLAVHQIYDPAINSGSYNEWGTHGNLSVPPMGYYAAPFYTTGYTEVIDINPLK